MATVVQKFDPSKQAALMVDDEGYLLVAGVGGGGSTPITKEGIKSRIVTMSVEDIVEVLRAVPEATRKEVLKELQ